MNVNLLGNYNTKTNNAPWGEVADTTTSEVSNCLKDEIFEETDEAFEQLVTNHAPEIRKLNEIQNIDTFIHQSFNFLKKAMHLDPNIKIDITDDDNQYDLNYNQVSISKNWTGNGHVLGKGNKAEIFGGLVHELNHYLQRKAFLQSYQHPRHGELINYLYQNNDKQTMDAMLSYIKDNYPENKPYSEQYKKGEEYFNSRQVYKNPNQPGYKTQPVEEEAFRRGNLVTQAYRNLINSPTSSTQTSNHWNYQKIPNSKSIVHEREKLQNAIQLRKIFQECGIEASTIKKLEFLEQQAIIQIYYTIKTTEKWRGLNQKGKNTILMFAIDDLDDKKYQNYTVHQFVKHFIEDYWNNLEIEE